MSLGEAESSSSVEKGRGGMVVPGIVRLWGGKGIGDGISELGV